MELLQLNLLGNLEIRLNGSPLPNFKSRKSQALLCYLVVTSRKHSREWLSTMFWGGLPENKARMNLSQSLTTLRRLFGPYLETTRRSVSIHTEAAIWTDVGVLETAMSGDLETLHQAADLYQGDFLQGVYIPNSPEFEFWTLEQRAHYRDIALQVLDQLARYYLQVEPAGLNAAIEFTNHRLKIEPWHEGTHRNLIRLYAANGQRSSALKQFDLCQQILLEELGVEPAKETLQLVEKIRTSDPAELANDSNLLAFDVPTVGVIQRISPINHARLPRFPHHPTEFFGREQELNALCDLILDQKTRLVTITGLGGIGKTRLAIEFGEQCLRQIRDQDPHMKQFEDGIIFVSLEALHTGQSILPAIAEALNFRLDQDDQQIIAYLQHRRLLLILDNFDHLQDNAILVSELLTGAPHLQCLVTSQDKLGLYGEQVFPLQGLTYPVDSAAGAADFPAGQLFLRAALRQDPNFTLAESDYTQVAKICQLVDGLPLAIELSATWVTSMPVASIPAQIQDNLELFSVDAPNLPERHRSLVTVIEGTLQRLPEDQRELFYQLSVFQGGFNLQAASAITGAGHRQLAELINKSLLRYSTSQDRYFLHPLLRQYAQQHYSSRMQEINQQYSHFYCQWFAEQTQPETLLAGGQKKVLDAMADEVENTRKAWLWALRNGDFKYLVGLTASIGLYYIWRGGYVEGARTLRSFIQAIGSAQEKQSAHRSLVMAALYDWLAYFLDIMGDSAQSISLLEDSEQFLEAPTLQALDITQEKAHHLLVYSRVNQSLTREMRNGLAAQAIALSRRGNNSPGLPLALFSAARFALLDGNNTLAEQFLAECLEIYRNTGDEIGMTTALAGLGNHAFVQNDYPQAKECFSASYAIAEEYNSPERSIVASWFWGTACIFSGQFNRAIQVLDRCAADSKQRGLPLYQATALYYLGYAYLHLGEYTRAEACAQEASPLADRSHYLEAVARIKILLGAIELARRKFEPALSLFGEAREISDNMEFGRILFGEDCDRFGRSCALISLGETQPAKRILQELLEEAVNTHRLDRLLYAFSGLALLNSNLGELESAGYFYLFGGSFPFVRNSRWIYQVSRESLRTKLDFSQVSWQQSPSPEDMWDFAREFLSQ